MSQWDVIIIGAGAAGLMCAIEAGKRGRKTLVLDHTNKAGKKILMSGGGRCNFTNYDVSASNYLSDNPHFCKSALSRFNQWDFLALVNKYNIPFHERDHGQLFCDNSAKDILNMLLDQCQQYDVCIQLNSTIKKITRIEQAYPFQIKCDTDDYQSSSLVIATGGLSIPKMSASPFGYKIADQFGIPVTPTRAGLVPFTWHQQDKQQYEPLSGIAVPAVVSLDQTHFSENVLFTHRGLSGPAILQISSFWQAGQTIKINWLPEQDLQQLFESFTPQTRVKNILYKHLPKRMVDTLWPDTMLDQPLQHWRQQQISDFTQKVHQWQLKPNGTEGYRTAEVTVGGVECNAISSRTMESKQVAGLYFIGEVLDVTGWLGGYNFQWAWSSGWVAGQNV